MIQQTDRKAQGINKQTMVFLVMTSFLDTIGFGIAGPVLPFVLQSQAKYPSTLALLIGLLTSIYALCQFLAAPVLGVLSDRYGRRPLLLICLLGSTLGYLLFGLGGAIWVFLLSRVLDGLSGGNDSILAAYIGDLSEKHSRAANFGLLGAVSGVGFLLGPVIGGFTATLGYQVPFFLAAGLTLVNLLWGCFFLPESLDKERRAGAARGKQAFGLLQQLGTVLRFGEVRWFLLGVFLYYLPFAAAGTLFAVLVKESMGGTPAQIGLLLVLVGVADIVVQGVLMRWLIPLLGETRVMIIGLICVIIGYLLFGTLVFAPSLISLLLAFLLFAGGGALAEPPLNSFLSEAAGAEHQGLVQGGSQSIQALAAMSGALAGGVLYGYTGHASPFWVGAGVIILLLLVLWKAIAVLRRKGR
jgi:DHA1 family tetracycline resistance protein-like MFS transporter